MKQSVIGILAHVDSGKTTLSEALLYNSGALKKLGRVDSGNAFLDTDDIEKERGITVFSHRAVLNTDNADFVLLDTPGHTDFSAETERTLRVLDYAILVVSGSEGVRSHTETLWRLLEIYNIPAFVFVNKTDIMQSSREEIVSELQGKLNGGCVDFSQEDDEFFEQIALCDKKLLEEFVEDGKISEESIAEAIAGRSIFPCMFGSALKNEGVAEFLRLLEKYVVCKKYPEEFGARVFKISEDDKGRRLTHLKVTGGSLKVKESLDDEKINELRIYSGEKYASVQEVKPGGVCAAVGLTKTFAGMGMGFETTADDLITEPVFGYSVRLPDGVDIAEALPKFKKLAEEETKLDISVSGLSINVRVMGEIQLEVLKRICADRFGLRVEFDSGNVIYKESVKGKTEGIGHYEPLRHYAEVHLLLEEGKRGSGIVIDSKCPADSLDGNQQRLIMTHIAEKEHLGALGGYPITDMKITVINGRAHKKHTEGGDFRQATYRAIRNGLRKAECVLLEPYYDFTLEIPTENVGRAMTDLQLAAADISPPEISGEISIIRGKAPVAAICEYQKEVTAYTRGRGRMSCVFGGYGECKNTGEVLAKRGYSADADVENTADSVFCKNGGGFRVKWDEVEKYAHIPPLSAEKTPEATYTRRQSRLVADEEELLRIFESTYGKVKRKTVKPMKTEKQAVRYKAARLPEGPEYLLIDGYNIIFAWDELKKTAEESLEDARNLLIGKLCNYKAVRDENIILVFDAYNVKGNPGDAEKVRGITVIYTKEAETADAYIEKSTETLCKKYRVKVATSDNLEQVIIFGHGAVRVTAAELKTKIENAENEMREFIRNNERSFKQ